LSLTAVQKAPIRSRRSSSLSFGAWAKRNCTICAASSRWVPTGNSSCAEPSGAVSITGSVRSTWIGATGAKNCSVPEASSTPYSEIVTPSRPSTAVLSAAASPEAYTSPTRRRSPVVGDAVSAPTGTTMKVPP
jgi:hypothetical protein